MPATQSMEVRTAGDTEIVEPITGRELLAHLAGELASAARLEELVDEQGAAIRARSVARVVQLAGELQAEMHRRGLLDHEREALMRRGAIQIDRAAGEVGLSTLCGIVDEESAVEARARASRLRSQLKRIGAMHRTNQALMRQELAFLDHLLRLAGGVGGYSTRGHGRGLHGARPIAQRMFDMEA